LIRGDVAVYPHIINSKCPLGSQYLNIHCKYNIRTLACKSNVQIGRPRCMFYVVHYSTKSNQKEDKGVDFERVGSPVIRCIQKETEFLLSEQNIQDSSESEKDIASEKA